MRSESKTVSASHSTDEGSCKMRNYLAGSIILLLAFSTVRLARLARSKVEPAAANQNRERNRANTPSATANLPF